MTDNRTARSKPLGTPEVLHDAIRNADLEACMMLLSRAPTLLRSGGQARPLHACAVNEFSQHLTGDLVRCGASVRDVDPRDGGTALHRMAERNRLYGAAALLAGGADVNARDGRRQTALHIAARERHRDMAMLLLAFGASSNADDADGKRASDYDPEFPWTSEGPTRSGAAAVQQDAARQ